MPTKHPNIVFVFPDQLRYCATGFGGDSNVRTPNLDRLAGESLHFTNAVSGCPVCSPARASLMTGQYPLTHGVFTNDAPLDPDAQSLAKVCREAGYETAYIGKWHLDGSGSRSAYIPPERRQGFDFWRTLECTHDYHHSRYYADLEQTPRVWEGYDAVAQTREALSYLESRSGDRPFLLALSWGPPHECHSWGPALQEYREFYDPEGFTLRPNVPDAAADAAGPDSRHYVGTYCAVHRKGVSRSDPLTDLVRHELVEYYANITMLDQLVGQLLGALSRRGLAENTIFVFWSDHGNMLGSHAQIARQRPWEECVRVPLLIRYPAMFGDEGKEIEAPISVPDLMPSLLGMCGLAAPSTVEGLDYTPFLRGTDDPPADAALLACYNPFAYFKPSWGGREYRGVRTLTHTYVRDLSGPWLLYDNQHDPYQMKNLADQPESAALQDRLNCQLDAILARQGDTFEPAAHYVRQWGYEVVDDSQHIPYED